MIALIQFRCLFLTTKKLLVIVFRISNCFQKLRGIKRGVAELGISYMERETIMSFKVKQ